MLDRDQSIINKNRLYCIDIITNHCTILGWGDELKLNETTILILN